MIDDRLYAINDVLTALANELEVQWDDEDDEDFTLNELTHIVYARFFREEVWT